MSSRAPGFDPQTPPQAVRRAEEAESRYMDQGDGDSQERLYVAIRAAVSSAPISECLKLHGMLSPEGEEGPWPGDVILEDDTPWMCNACNEYVGVGVDFEQIQATHQAHMVRLLFLTPGAGAGS